MPWTNHLSVALYILWAYLVCAPAALASSAEDSVRFVLGSEHSIAERAHAITSMALRTLKVDPAGSLSTARNALLVAEQSGDLKAEHEALRALSAAQFQLGLNAEYLQTAITALEIAQLMSDPRAIALDLQSLSTAYQLNMQMDKAVDEARNALAAVLPAHNAEAIDQAYRFLMHTLLRAARFQEALQIGEKALVRFTKRPAPADEARIWYLTAQVLLAQGKSGDALPFLVKAERVLAVEGTANERFDLVLDRAKAMIGIGRNDEA